MSCIFWWNWVHYDKLAFLLPVIGASKSRDTLKQANLQENDNEASTGDTPAVKRKTVAERKLLCTDAITRNAKAPQQDDSAATKVSSFFLYIEEKLSQLDKRHRRVAEKRIFKFLFEIKMSADLPPDGEVNR